MKLFNGPVVIENGRPVKADTDVREKGIKKTLTYGILNSHDDHSDDHLLHIRFDSLTSHDITYVSIIQTAKASGIDSFAMPYVLTNCHNSLCAVGGTINEDDHRFALSAAKKYGGIFVPAHYAVIHSYNREMMAGCGKMILGSDSHTRYGALGCMGIGEGGGELTKQLVGKTYDITYPETVLVYVHGEIKNGVGPHDVALSLVAATYENGFVKWYDRVKNISKQIGATVSFFAHPDTLEQIKILARRNKFGVATKFEVLDDWDDFLMLTREVGDNDLLVVVSSRKTAISYNPAMDKLPLQLSKYFASNSFIVLYPDQFDENTNTTSYMV